MTDDERRERRERWDERHREHEIESEDPDGTLVARVSGLPPGRAFELACGSGTNAVWLARAGWRVTGVDWSAVALEKARRRADAAGVSIEWRGEDLLTWRPPEAAYDLVTALYLHLVPDERRVVYAAAARAVAPGGKLLVIGHDRQHRGPGPDAERLFTAAELGAEIAAIVPALEVEEALVVPRGPDTDSRPVDAVLRMHRRSG